MTGKSCCLWDIFRADSAILKINIYKVKSLFACLRSEQGFCVFIQLSEQKKEAWNFGERL